MDRSHEERPLSRPSPLHTVGDEEKIATARNRRKHFLRRCCAFCAAGTVINIIVSVILMLTLFRSRNPVIRLNKITVVKIDLINGTNTPIPGSNATFIIDISTKNPNYVSLKHRATTMTVYYRGVVVGEMHSLPGTEKARRTTRTNATVEIITDRLLSIPGLDSDVKSGLFTSSGYSRFHATMKFFFVKMRVRLKMNCTATVNLTSLEILHNKCKKKVKLF